MIVPKVGRPCGFHSPNKRIREGFENRRLISDVIPEICKDIGLVVVILGVERVLSVPIPHIRAEYDVVWLVMEHWGITRVVQKDITRFPRYCSIAAWVLWNLG